MTDDCRPVHRVAMGRVVEAPAGTIYALLADYRDGHPRIVPPQYFGQLHVEQGGVGAGTIVRVTVRIAGVAKQLRLVVTEPEPGRVLMETDVDSGAETSFVIESLEGDRRTQVTIASVFPISSRLFGWLERWLTAYFLRRIYAAELALLADIAETESRHRS